MGHFSNNNPGSMIMAQGLFYFLLNKYLNVTVLFGIIKQITHGSEGDGTDYQPEENNILPCVIYILFAFL